MTARTILHGYPLESSYPGDARGRIPYRTHTRAAGSQLAMTSARIEAWSTLEMTRGWS